MNETNEYTEYMEAVKALAIAEQDLKAKQARYHKALSALNTLILQPPAAAK
jgi:hypothetical protein